MDATLELDDTEELDLSQEDHEIKKHEDIIIDLQNIYTEIEKSATINKTIAMAIESIQEGTLSKNTPINSFTKEMSKTNLNVAMEDIIDMIINSVKFIFRTISKMFNKIIDFIKRLFRRTQNKEEYNQKIVEKSKVLVKEIYDLKGRFANADRKIYDDIFKDISSEANAELKEMHNDLINEIVNSNNVNTAMTAVGSDFNRYISDINSKFTIVEGVIGDAKKIKASEANFKLSQVDKYIKNGKSDASLRSMMKSNCNGTIANDFPLLKEYIYHLSESKTTNQINYQKIFDQLNANRLVLNDHFILDLTYSEKNLESLEKTANKLSKKVDELKSDFDVNIHIKNSVKIIKDEVIALQMFVFCCSKVVSVNSTISNFIYTTINKHYKLLLTAARNSSSITTQNAAKASYHKT